MPPPFLYYDDYDDPWWAPVDNTHSVASVSWFANPTPVPPKEPPEKPLVQRVAPDVWAAFGCPRFRDQAPREAMWRHLRRIRDRIPSTATRHWWRILEDHISKL